MATKREPCSYATKVHVLLECQDEDCDWYNSEWLDDDEARIAAEEHHYATGHEIHGEYGYAVWVGREGREKLERRAKKMLAMFGLDKEDE